MSITNDLRLIVDPTNTLELGAYYFVTDKLQKPYSSCFIIKTIEHVKNDDKRIRAIGISNMSHILNFMRQQIFSFTIDI